MFELADGRQRFFSVYKKYSGSQEPDLELRCEYIGRDNIEIELVNLCYKGQCRTLLRRFLMLSSLSGIYFGVIMQNNVKIESITSAYFLYPAALFLVLSVHILISTLTLVRSEKVLYCWSVALQIEVERAFMRHLFIPASYIHDMVLNEVIKDLDIQYVLIIRTKGKLFKEKPIIPLFRHLNPTGECLREIYKLLCELFQRDAGAKNNGGSLKQV